MKMKQVLKTKDYKEVKEILDQLTWTAETMTSNNGTQIYKYSIFNDDVAWVSMKPDGSYIVRI